MSWWELNSKSFCCYPAKRSLNANTLVGPLHKNFLPIFCKGNFSRHALVGPQHKIFPDNFEMIVILIDMHWRDLNTKSCRLFSTVLILMVMHWWDLNTKSYCRFSANRKTYRHSLVEP